MINNKLLIYIKLIYDSLNVELFTFFYQIPMNVFNFFLIFQVYKGLDIVTNKVTSEEKEAAVHHMIDHVDPLSRFTVVDFQNQALPIVSS